MPTSLNCLSCRPVNAPLNLDDPDTAKGAFSNLGIGSVRQASAVDSKSKTPVLFRECIGESTEWSSGCGVVEFEVTESPASSQHGLLYANRTAFSMEQRHFANMIQTHCAWSNGLNLLVLQLGDGDGLGIAVLKQKSKSQRSTAFERETRLKGRKKTLSMDTVAKNSHTFLQSCYCLKKKKLLLSQKASVPVSQSHHSPGHPPPSRTCFQHVSQGSGLETLQICKSSDLDSGHPFFICSPTMVNLKELTWLNFQTHLCHCIPGKKLSPSPGRKKHALVEP